MPKVTQLIKGEVKTLNPHSHSESTFLSLPSTLPQNSKNQELKSHFIKRKINEFHDADVADDIVMFFFIFP